MIVVGVDAHRDTHTAAAVDGVTAALVEDRTVPARPIGNQALLKWAASLDSERVWAIEDCRNLSGALERFLLAHGERVLRVPPKLMSKERKTIRSFGKSDAIDALAVARGAIREPDLPVGRLAGVAREIRLLADFRDDLVGEHTRHQHRLREHLHDLDPDLQPALRCLAGVKNIERLARRLARMEQTTQVLICRELVRRIRELTRRCEQLERQLAVLVRQTCPALTEIEGCGTLTAARILADVEDIERFRNERHLASYCGVAPLDASSGRQQRHRLNRIGNRRLNRCLHIIAVTQIRTHAPARDYLARRISEGKTNHDALRALKRYLARRLFRILTSQTTDSAPRPAITGTAPMNCLT